MSPMETPAARLAAPVDWTARPLSLSVTCPAWMSASAALTGELVRSQLLPALRAVVFPMLWLFIGAVSSYDAYLTIKYEDSIAAMELNPLGQYLLQQNDGDAALFMGMKFVGTIVVLGALNLIHRARPQWGMWMTGSVATFQGGLLGFLSM